MRLTFYGAVRTVTGSMHLLEVGGKRILLDCGMYQGKREPAFKKNRHFPFDPASIDKVVLSHAHIDHSGNLPTLVRKGFDGDIETTSATRDLCAIMLRDSGHIQESNVEYVNKKRARKGLPLFNPLYTIEDAENTIPLFVGRNYNRWFQLTPEIAMVFHDAGHILGSAIVVMDIKENGENVRLVFTGDLGRKNLPILKDPFIVRDADYMIMESTYGNRVHGDNTEIAEELAVVVNETYKRGGKVIIPAFSVERTQEIIYHLHFLINKGEIPELPIFVDSPLAINATNIFRIHTECFDEEMKNFLMNEDDPLGFDSLNYTRSVAASKSINKVNKPSVIISASGMCEAGRILHHLKNNIEDERNTILIVSYQAPNTLGRRLANREKTVKVFGEKYTRRAQVKIINGFSGHADRNDLLNYVKNVKGGIDTVFLVHGEMDQIEALKSGIEETSKDVNVVIPDVGDSFELKNWKQMKS